jgi:hypothetical protein
MKISINLNNGGFAQIYSSGPVFGFVSEKGEHCHSFYFCKDFMNDAIAAQFNNKSMGIYGFNHDPKKHPNLDLSKTRIVFSNKDDKQMADRIPAIQDILNQACKLLKLTKCKVENVGTHGDYKDVLYITGSKDWMVGGPAMSLLTLLVRVGAVHTPKNNIMDTLESVMKGEIKPYGSNDASYIKSSIDGIKFLFENGFSALGDMSNNYNPNISIGTIHNTGIVGYSNTLRNPKSTSSFPHWAKYIESKKVTV